MNNLKQAKELVRTLSAAEKTELVAWVVGALASAFPGIEKTPGACGGNTRIAGTRIPVWSLVQAKNLGYSDERLLYEYPTLQAEHLNNAWKYYQVHTMEIDAQIRANEEA